MMVWEGAGGTADQPGAMRLSTKACNDGFADSCGFVGSTIYDEGRGPAAEWPKARAWLEKGCAGGSKFGCLHLGRFLRAGIGGAKNENRAGDVFEWACFRGMAAACKELETLPD